jgi:hypothetical protein
MKSALPLDCPGQEQGLYLPPGPCGFRAESLERIAQGKSLRFRIGRNNVTA